MSSIRSSVDAASARRQTRLRREYLYRRSLEGRERASYESKRAVRNALSTGQPLPTELRSASVFDDLAARATAEDARTAELDAPDAVRRSTIDDEYGNAGLFDPRVCLTTSHDPSSRLKQFAKEVRFLIPNATRINRGTMNVKSLVSSCRESNFTDLVVVQETRGEPDGLVVCHLPLGPTAFFTLSHAVLRHDLEGGKAAPMSEAYPHVILHNFDRTELGRRVGNILKCLFPVPKPETRRLVTFANDNDFISFRHHMYTKKPGASKVEDVTLHEVGPRFEMRLYQIRLGTLDQKEAELEYELRAYQNTSRKRQVL